MIIRNENPNPYKFFDNFNQEVAVSTERYEIGGHVFEWDRGKNLSNIRKHGVTFKIAAKAFFDPCADVYEDEEHSQAEERFILIGMDEEERILAVCHCYRGEGESITRIISARKATEYEEDLYGGVIE